MLWCVLTRLGGDTDTFRLQCHRFASPPPEPPPFVLVVLVALVRVALALVFMSVNIMPSLRCGPSKRSSVNDAVAKVVMMLGSDNPPEPCRSRFANTMAYSTPLEMRSPRS